MNNPNTFKHLFLILTSLMLHSSNLIASTDEEVSTFSSYIEKNFDVIFKSPLVANSADADFFLLAEQHDLLGHKHINTDLVNRFASKEDILFIEGVPSLHRIKRNASLQTIWITAPVKILGWDAGWLKDITGIDCTHIEKLGMKLYQIQHEIVWSQNHQKKQKYFEIIAKLQPLIHEISPLFTKEFEEVIKDKFSARVSAMCQSLNAVQQDSTKKTFLIAGLYHLWVDHSNPFFTDSKMSLALLSDFLNTKKAIILIPKQDVTSYWNSFYRVVDQ